jgi:hypothetical protein
MNTLAARTDTILNDARFDSAIVALATGLLDFYASGALWTRLVADRGQFHTAAVAYVIDPVISADAICRLLPPGLTTRSRVPAYLAMLEGRKGLVPAPLLPDRRFKPRQLAPDLRDWLTQWMQAIVRPGLMFASLPWPDLDDPATARDCFAQFVFAQRSGIRLLAASPNVERGLDRRGGHLVLFELMRRSHAATPPVAFSRRQFAHRFGMTRSQLVTMLAEAAEDGIVQITPHGPELTPFMRAQGRQWMAMHLAVAALTLEGQLLAAIGAAPPPASQSP